MKTEYMTIYSWAKKVGITPCLAYNWAKRGKLKGLKKVTKVSFLIPKDTKI